MAKLTLRSTPLENPFGRPVRPLSNLATRPQSLKGKRLLLLDNGQVDAEKAAYGAFLDGLEDVLRSTYGAKPVRLSHNLLRENLASLDMMVPVVKKFKPQAVVIALCHGGVTAPSIMLAVRLEQVGIPTVLVCTPLGIKLGAVSAQSYAPGLPLVLARPSRTAGQGSSDSSTQSLARDVVWALTASARRLTQHGRRVLTEHAGAALPTRLPRVTSRQESRRLPRAVTATVDASELDETLYTFCCEHFVGDGLPLFAPTRRRVAAMLDCTDWPPDEVLIEECPPSGSAFTVRAVAANAVMAGCKPEYFPIILTAIQAMAAPTFRLFQAAITTHPSGNLVLVSGPLAKELGIQSNAGCVGPGFRANATIGRAVNLATLNIARSLPGLSSLCTFGSPAQYTFCFAENIEDSPWPSLHAERYGPQTTCVTVHKCEAPHNAIDNAGKSAEGILDVIASKAATIGGSNATNPSELVVLLTPANARLLAAAGYSKKDVQRYLFDRARNSAVALAKSPRKQWPAWFHHLDAVPVVRRAEDIYVVVCGGMGPHSMVCVPWGFSRAVTRPVVTKQGEPVRTIGKGKEESRRRRV